MIPPTQSENTLYTLGWDVAGEVIAAWLDCTLLEKVISLVWSISEQEQTRSY